MTPVLLLCGSCGKRKSMEVTAEEMTALKHEEPLSRNCEECKETTEWFLAERLLKD